MFRRKWVIAAGGALLVVVLGSGAVMAQSTGTGTGSTFLDRVAQKLGIDTPKLQQAITDTHNEDIATAVANGDLTQKQADALKQREQNNPGFGGGPGFGGPGMMGGRGGPNGFGPGFGFNLGIGDAAQNFATFLGIPVAQLMTELKADNATLATVAAAHGKSRDDLKTYITTAVKTKLDAAVASGDLTQKREDSALTMLSTNIDKLIDGKFFSGGFGHHRGMPGGPKPRNNASPNTPAPQSGSGTDGTQSF
jgi:hypothetical protein